MAKTQVPPQAMRGRGLGDYIGFDGTDSEDKVDRVYHPPQVQDSWRSFPLWGHRTDNFNESLYRLRQVFSLPNSIFGVFRTLLVPFVGMAIKHTLWAVYLSIGYWTLVPGLVILVFLLAILYAVLMSRNGKAFFGGVFLNYFLVTLGFFL